MCYAAATLFPTTKPSPLKPHFPHGYSLIKTGTHRSDNTLQSCLENQHSNLRRISLRVKCAQESLVTRQGRAAEASTTATWRDDFGSAEKDGRERPGKICGNILKLGSRGWLLFLYVFMWRLVCSYATTIIPCRIHKRHYTRLSFDLFITNCHNVSGTCPNIWVERIGLWWVLIIPK